MRRSPLSRSSSRSRRTRLVSQFAGEAGGNLGLLAWIALLNEELLHKVEEWVRQGIPLDTIMERLPTNLGRERLDALWLFAWSLQERLKDGLDQLRKVR